MKRLPLILRLPVAFMVALFVAEVTGGCGLLDSSASITIPVPDQTFTFSLNASLITSTLEQQTGIDLSGVNEIPQGINTVLVLTMPPQKVDYSNQEQLREYIDATKVKAVKIKSVRYNIKTNSLNYDLPELEIYMDNFEVTQFNPNTAQKVAVIPAIQAQTTGEGSVLFTVNGPNIMSNYLLLYKFALLGRVVLTIDTTGHTLPIPSGSLEGEVTVTIHFTVDPL